MATRLERMEESLANYRAKIVETEKKIEDEKAALIAKKGDAEAKLREAQEKFKALYGGLEGSDAEDTVGDTTEDKNLFN